MVNPFSGYGRPPVAPIAQETAWQFPEGPYLEITPQIAQRFQRRLDNAQSDQELTKVVRDAAKYGVDWTHLLAPMIGTK